MLKKWLIISQLLKREKLLLPSSIEELKEKYSNPIISFEILETNSDLINLLHTQDWIVTAQENFNEYKATVKRY